MREAKTIQTHPDNDNTMISFYEQFGWELQSNQRCQETKYRGDDKYTSTFNKITFTREKNSTWHKRMCELEEEASMLLKLEAEDYPAVKDEYGYEDRLKLGKRPTVKALPKFAEPKKFFIPFAFFLICAICALLSASSILSSMEAGAYESEGEGAIFVTGWATVILFFVSLSKIKFLKGLKGAKKKKAIEEFNESSAALKAYDEKVEEFFSKRYDEIIAEAEALLSEGNA